MVLSGTVFKDYGRSSVFVNVCAAAGGGMGGLNEI